VVMSSIENEGACYKRACEKCLSYSLLNQYSNDSLNPQWRIKGKRR